MDTTPSLGNSRPCSARSFARRTFTLIACALAFFAAPRGDQSAARAASRNLIGETIPIGLTVTPQSGGSGRSNLATTVQVDRTGGHVEGGTAHPGGAQSPTRAAPVAVRVAPGRSAFASVPALA